MSIKNYINSKLEIFLSFILMKSLSNFGYRVREFKSQCYSNNCFQYNKYINLLRNFYAYEAEGYCQKSNLSYIDELLFRRKELKNQSNYLLSVGVGIGTGIPVGIFVNNISKFSFFISNPNDGFIQVLYKLFFFLLVMLFVFLLVFIILAIYKFFSNSSDPLEEYSEEEELQIIEEHINRTLNNID